MKQCVCCQDQKSHDQFGKDKNRQDGLTIYCRDCRKNRYAELRAEGKIIRGGTVIKTPPRMSDCEYCGVEYQPKTAFQRFCSVKCGAKARPPRPPHERPRTRMDSRQRPCEQCGSIYKPWNKESRFCSLKCKGKSMRSGLGAKLQDSEGYIRMRVKDNDPGAINGWMLEHRYVMQESLGRPLDSHETVHHINGDKTDNRLENLQLRQGRHGKGVVMHCMDCGSQNLGKISIA